MTDSAIHGRELDSGRPAAGSEASTLSTVEAAVLELTAEGLTTAQIAKRLHYSHSSVNQHLAILGGRFGTNNRTALVSRAYVLGLLRADCWPPRASAAPEAG